MTTDAAISKLIAIVKAGRTVHSSGADDRGLETAGSAVSLRLEEGLFVAETVDWHESNGFRDRESLTRWTRAESGLFELLRADRYLLKALLRSCDAFVANTTRDEPARKAGSGPESVEAILEHLETGSDWFLLSVTPMFYEQALIHRPSLGWRYLETDCAHDVALESVVRSLKPPPGDVKVAVRDRCAELIQGALRTRPGAVAQRLPAGIEAQLSSLELRCESARQQLGGGAWWLEDGRASGLVRGRAVTVEHDGSCITEVISRDAPLLEQSLLDAFVRSAPVVLGDPPPQLQLLEEWLDMAALAARVASHEVVVETFPGGWTSAQELPAALSAANVWIARSHGQREDAARRARERRWSQLVQEALRLAAGRALTDSRDEDQGSESVRDEHELRARDDGMFLLVHRKARMRDGAPIATEERRLIAGESGMRGGLSAWNSESLERAVAAARAQAE